MLLVTLKTGSTVSEHSKVTADALTSTHTDMREQTVVASAAPVVGKVHAERCTLRGGIVGEIASVSGVRTLALKIVPANGNLGGVVLIHASETTGACACKSKR